MINLFSVFEKGGTVLWSNEEKPPSGNPVNMLIQDVLLEEKQADEDWTYDRYKVKWSFLNEFNLVFVAVYLKVQRLSYIDEFLQKVTRRFVEHFQKELAAGTKIIGSLGTQFQDSKKMEEWSRLYKETLQRCEKKGTRGAAPRAYQKPKSKGAADFTKTQESQVGSGGTDDGDGDAADESTTADVTPSTTAEASSPAPDSKAAKKAAFMAKMKGRKGRKRAGPGGFKGKGKNRGKGTPEKKPPKKKEKRDWSSLGIVNKGPVSQKDMESLDQTDAQFKKKEGDDYEVVTHNKNEADFDESDDEWESEPEEEEKSSGGGMWSYFTKIAGTKALTKDDVEPALEKMRLTLMNKNVAGDISQKIVDSVAESLVGQTTGTFRTIKTVVREASEKALERVLTPARPVNILHGIQTAREQRRPYSIVFVGVNGVGKSTSLAKVINYLQNKRKFQVSVAACDTFRAGAVEQLKTHCRALGARLFHQGYAKDPAYVAAEAIKKGKAEGDDVVLVDTAGRMQDNEPLMRALSKLIVQNNPDLVLFVGEALVGNDGVDQLVKFNQALEDNSASANPRLIDGMVLTKFDTVDDKVGAAISMAYITRKPIVFIGTGQNYDDIKRLHVKTLINKLLR